MAVQDINTLLGIGGLQQSQEQKQLDIDRANELGREGLPFQRIGFLSDVLRGVPSMNQTYMRTTTPSPSTGSQLLGLLTAGIGGIGEAGGFNRFFGFKTFLFVWGRPVAGFNFISCHQCFSMYS